MIFLKRVIWTFSFILPYEINSCPVPIHQFVFFFFHFLKMTFVFFSFFLGREIFCHCSESSFFIVFLPLPSIGNVICLPVSTSSRRDPSQHLCIRLSSLRFEINFWMLGLWTRLIISEFGKGFMYPFLLFTLPWLFLLIYSQHTPSFFLLNSNPYHSPFWEWKKQNLFTNQLS